MTILLVIAILVFLIVAHEFGHFIAAKYFKVRVDEFGVGYPPRAFLIGKWGGTEYTLNWLPFGGFVRLFGETQESGHGSLASAARWKQAIILVAGVTMNAVVAYFLFVAAFTQGVPRIIDEPLPGEHAQLYVSDVVPGSPADAAGIKAGDEIIALTDSSGRSPEVLAPEAMTDFVRERGGQALSITYLRAHATTTISVQPANAVVPGAAGRPAIGVGLVAVSVEALPLGRSFIESLTTLQNAFLYVGQSLWRIVSGALTGTADITQVVGPVGLVGVIGDASRSGVGYVLELAGFISVNLAIVNLIPIPALDGGRLVVLGMEAITRRRSPRFAIQLLNTVGIALIILLMITVTYNDIARLFA